MNSDNSSRHYEQNQEEVLSRDDAPRPHEANDEEISSDDLPRQHEENDRELNSSNAIIPAWNDENFTTYNILAWSLRHFIRNVCKIILAWM